MFYFLQLLEGVSDFLNLGGTILQFLMVLLVVMWALIFERIWYYKGGLKKDETLILDTWGARLERKSKSAHQVRAKYLSQINMKIDQYLALIKALIALAPLFGLLGTVTGMITVFEVMAITGGGDAKSMSSGVSMATIPTMAGMVAALSGVFGFTYLERVAKNEKQLMEDRMTMG